MTLSSSILMRGLVCSHGMCQETENTDQDQVATTFKGQPPASSSQVLPPKSSKHDLWTLKTQR